MSTKTAVEMIQDMMDRQQEHITRLRARLSDSFASTPEDMEIHSRITYHRGVESGLAQAVFALMTEEENA